MTTPTPLRITVHELNTIERLHKALMYIRSQYLLGFGFGLTTLAVNLLLLLSSEMRQPSSNIAMCVLGLFAVAIGWRARRIERRLRTQLAATIADVIAQAAGRAAGRES